MLYINEYGNAIREASTEERKRELEHMGYKPYITEQPKPAVNNKTAKEEYEENKPAKPAGRRAGGRRAGDKK